jgi:protein-disulfide isomerase
MKYFPLNSHQYAALAARAAQAAKNQGKFYEMHSLLFENQKRWSGSGSPSSIFVSYARDLDLDVDKFKNDLNAAETQKIVMEQRQEGRNAGVNATPTFFIEGEKVDPLPRNFQEFDQLIQQYIEE